MLTLQHIARFNLVTIRYSIYLIIRLNISLISFFVNVVTAAIKQPTITQGMASRTNIDHDVATGRVFTNKHKEIVVIKHENKCLIISG